MPNIPLETCLQVFIVGFALGGLAVLFWEWLEACLIKPFQATNTYFTELTDLPEPLVFTQPAKPTSPAKRRGHPRKAQSSGIKTFTRRQTSTVH